MPIPDPTGILARAALLRACAPAELAAIAAAGTPRRVEQDGFFFQQGDPAGHVHVLTGGRVRLTQLSVDGQQVVLRVIVPGQMFGAVGLTQSAAEYPCAAQAIEDSQALAWENALGYVNLLRGHIHKEDNILFPLAGRVIPTQEQEGVTEAFDQVEHEETGEGAHETYLALAEAIEKEALS
jgi:hypothetical protein